MIRGAQPRVPCRRLPVKVARLYRRRTSGSLAKFAAMRRASSLGAALPRAGRTATTWQQFLGAGEIKASSP